MTGKVVFITGAANGLGRAYALHLAARGALVAVADIDEAGLSSVVASITESGGKAMPIGMDVTDEASVESGFATAAARLGRIDVLVNNAGGLFSVTSLDKVSLAEWNKTIELNLTGSWLCARAVIPAMREAKSGRIINIASGTIDRGLPLNLGPYIAAKAGVVGLTRVLARELGPFGVTVNAVSPGLFAMDKPRDAFMVSTINLVESQQSLPRPGEPSDIVGMIEFLASDAASFITGQVYNVDGGFAFR